MGRRTLLLITSILIAAIGAALVGLYARGADQRATQHAEAIYGPRPAITATPSPTATPQHPDITGVGLTVEISDPDRAIGLLQPGDYIALYTVAKTGRTHPVAARVKVISVGTTKTIDTKTSDTVPADVLGLDAPIDQAVAIERAKSAGQLVVFVLGARADASASAAARLT
jgi:hypothetical protein